MCTIYLNFTECIWPQPVMIFTNWDEFKIPNLLFITIASKHHHSHEVFSYVSVI